MPKVKREKNAKFKRGASFLLAVLMITNSIANLQSYGHAAGAKLHV